MDLFVLMRRLLPNSDASFDACGNNPLGGERPTNNQLIMLTHAEILMHRWEDYELQLMI